MGVEAHRRGPAAGSRGFPLVTPLAWLSGWLAAVCRRAGGVGNVAPRDRKWKKGEGSVRARETEREREGRGGRGGGGERGGGGREGGWVGEESVRERKEKKIYVNVHVQMDGYEHASVCAHVRSFARAVIFCLTV